MFYYPTVLRHHTGCFSTIWLVATKGIRVPRRDFLKVNVKRTCDDIMNYVLERVPPPRPGLPRPRFSLYLSSQLQYGVIVVYHRQCAILLEELHTIVGQLLKEGTPQKIDMEDQGRHSLDLPDALSLLEETERALDPLFGRMDMSYAMASPSTLIQRSEELLRGVPPEHPDLTSEAATDVVERDITASPDTITLRETESVSIPVTEFEGAELIDQPRFTVDLLMAETDHFPEDFEMSREEEPEEREIEREGRERDLEEERMKELTGSKIEIQPSTLFSEEAILLPQEEPRLTAEKPKLLPDQLTPVSEPVHPSPPPAERKRDRMSIELEEVPPPEPKVRRRRQLVFFDAETQLSQEELQQQIDDPLTETRPPTLIPPSSHRRLPAAEFLNNPCTFLPEQVESLWRRAATITPISGSDLQVGERGTESTDSERDRECEMVEAAEREEDGFELSPTEVQRDVTDTGDMAYPERFDISGLGALESSDQKERSREISPILPHEKERSPVSRSVSTMQDIPEVEDEFQETAPAEEESPGLSPDDEPAPVFFESLLPPEVDRITVSITFQRLLESVSARVLRVEQNEPYGNILILPGPNFKEELLTSLKFP